LDKNPSQIEEGFKAAARSSAAFAGNLHLLIAMDAVKKEAA